jgi:uncharacterized membrane protein
MEGAVAAAPAPRGPGPWARFRSFAASRRHDFPGVLALAALAVLEILSTQVLIVTDVVNQYGPSALTDGHYQLRPYIGLAGVFLPFVIAAWLFGKRRPIRIMFVIAIWVSLINVVTSLIQVLGTINTHVGNVGAATLLTNAGLLWIMNVVVFALWYWSTDAGGPDLRGTARARRPDFDFPQQRHEIHGWEGWMPGFHDYLHAAFTISLTFHAAGAEILSGRSKYVNMVQATVSVSILLLLVAKAIATFTPGG